jgi:tripartite-type tricarboxylate transporter receptor subunit TctC
MKNVVCGLLAAATVLWLGAATAQQKYPTKSIRFIVADVPGSTTDLVARALEPILSERLRQAVVIENRPGAGGNTGIDVVAKSAPDGYTIGLGTAGALAANVSLYPKMPYHPATDLAPVSNVAFVPFMLIVHPKVPASTLEELIVLARAKPGELLLGHGGNGTAMHLSGELFKLMATLQMVNVPYKGSAPVAKDVAGGQLQLGIVDVGAGLPYVKAGTVKAIAVTSARRVAAAPQVPTFAESGLPGYEATGWFGIVANARTPADIVGRLNTDIVAALKRAEVRDRIIAAGAEPAPSTPAAFGELIRSEIDKWAEVVKISGARAD